MQRSVGRSSLLAPTMGLALLLAGCNGNGHPVGVPVVPTSSFQAPPDTQNKTSGTPINVGGLQASDATLNAVLAAMNSARAGQGGSANLPAYSRDPSLDTCANLIAVQASNGAAPSSTCGASQESAGTITGGDQTSDGQSAVAQWVAEGAPPQGQTNDFSNIMSVTFRTVGIGVVTNNGKTYIVVLFK